MPNRSTILPFCATGLLVVTVAGCAGTTPPPRLSPVDPSLPQAPGAALRAAPDDVRRLLEGGLQPAAAARIAVLNNPQLLAGFEEVGVSRAALAEASALENPEFTGLVRFGGGTNTEFSLLANIFDVFARPARKGIAAVELERARARLSYQVLTLATEARTAVLRLQAQEELVRRLATIEALATTGADFAQRQLAAGTLGALEAENQAALQMEAQLDLTRARADAVLGRERVNRLLGLWGGDTAWQLGGPLPELPAVELELAGLEETAVSQRQDVAAARFGVDLVGRALAARRKTRFFPAGLHAGISTERDAAGGPRVTGPEVALQLPIFNTGSASLRRLEAEHRRAQRLLEAAALTARSEVREAGAKVLASRELATSWRDTLLPQRRRVLALTLQRYNSMFASAYDLLLAKRAEVEAERAYVDAWRDYWIARAELEAALGGALPGEATSEGEKR